MTWAGGFAGLHCKARFYLFYKQEGDENWAKSLFFARRNTFFLENILDSHLEPLPLPSEILNGL